MVREKQWYWSLVPLAGRNRYATTLGSSIFLPPSRFQEWKRGHPSLRTRALVAHEEVHVKQWQAEGLRFVLGYWLSRSRRLEYEAQAYAQQARILWQGGAFPDLRALFRWLSSRSQALASWRYLWTGSAHQALKRMIYYLAQGGYLES